MMTLANYGIGSSKQKDPNSAKSLSKSLQIRNRAELLLKQCLKSNYRITDDKRNEILNSIKDYYSRVSFNAINWNKYRIKQCIIDSILLLDSKFNPYKARDAFILVEKMLINLVYLPWHPEFTNIRTYSGAFRLSISNPLIGIEEVFKAAGFKDVEGSPMHLVLPRSMMPQVDDGESVSGVIFDCLLAQVVFSNIIEVFESCLKSSKLPEDKSGDINCYSWIQAYFQERWDNTTERSCANIQELLNNITNHLAKLDSAPQTRPSPQNERILSQPNQSNERPENLNTKSDASRSSKLSAQDRTRNFLAQQSSEDERLARDLLKIPAGIHEQTKRSLISDKSSDISSGVSYKTSNARAPIREAMHQPTSRSDVINSGYHESLFEQPTHKQTETYDNIDSSHSTHFHREFDRPNNQHASEFFNNDLEPLIGRHDRKLMQPNQSQQRRVNPYEENFDAARLMNDGNHIGSAKHQFDIPYFEDTPSHQQTYNNQLRGSSSSKYDYQPTHRRFEDNKLNNTKSLWSCGSCTYNNQISSEICEMCRNRRPIPRKN